MFYGCGASIKKAQQAAADVALKETTLSRPPERILMKKYRKGQNFFFFFVLNSVKFCFKFNFNSGNVFCNHTVYLLIYLIFSKLFFIRKISKIF